MADEINQPGKIYIIYNPASGRFNPHRLEALQHALVHHGFAPACLPTRPDGVAIPDDARLICVSGGDGTLRLVVRALAGRAGRVALSVYPAGTINLVARELGYSDKPSEFAAHLAAAWARGPEGILRSPLLTSASGPVIACLSIGPDSAAVAGVSPALKQKIGRLAYLVAGLRLLWAWPRPKIRINALLSDGSRLEEQAEAVFVARGRYYAGPFCLSPAARLDSTSFELITLTHAGRWRSLAFMLVLMLGLRPERLGLAQLHSATMVELDAHGAAAQVDGDPLSVAGPIRLEIAPETYLRFCA